MARLLLRQCTAPPMPDRRAGGGVANEKSVPRRPPTVGSGYRRSITDDPQASLDKTSPRQPTFHRKKLDAAAATAVNDGTSPDCNSMAFHNAGAAVMAGIKQLPREFRSRS